MGALLTLFMFTLGALVVALIAIACCGGRILATAVINKVMYETIMRPQNRYYRY